MKRLLKFRNVSDFTVTVKEIGEFGKEIGKTIKGGHDLFLSEGAYLSQKQDTIFVDACLLFIGGEEVEGISDNPNQLTDGDIADLLKQKNVDVVEALKDVTSKVTLKRVLEKADRKGITEYIGKQLA